MLWEDFSVKESRDVSKPIENKNLHEIGNDNRGRIINFVTSRDVIAEITVSSHIVRFICLLKDTVRLTKF